MPDSDVWICRDAEEAAQARDGYDFYGTTLRVELARGGSTRGGRGPPRAVPRGGGGGGGGRGGSQYRVTIRGLPASASWQDLKVCLKQARQQQRPQVSSSTLFAVATASQGGCTGGVRLVACKVLRMAPCGVWTTTHLPSIG